MGVTRSPYCIVRTVLSFSQRHIPASLRPTVAASGASILCLRFPVGAKLNLAAFSVTQLVQTSPYGAPTLPYSVFHCLYLSYKGIIIPASPQTSRLFF
jgi:hypothetical protein